LIFLKDGFKRKIKMMKNFYKKKEKLGNCNDFFDFQGFDL